MRRDPSWPKVTIVLATYNRPDVLRVAIRSVLRQSMTRWRLLVIGDACDARTGEVVQQFGDRRIHYLNLPTRCGDQALPNTIGMRLADTEAIALLNHDDIWLQDHLATALADLETTGADLFLGRAAHSRRNRTTSDGRSEPLFTDASAEHRPLEDVFTRGAEPFEPCSTWVFRRNVVETVGPWRHSTTIFRIPIEDWLMRAWRAGIAVAQPRNITALRILSHYRRPLGAHAYEHLGAENDHFDQLLERLTAGQIRDLVDDQIDSETVTQVERTRIERLFKTTAEETWLLERLLTRNMGDVYYRTGWDAFSQFCVLTGRERGFTMKRTLQRRTGETLSGPPEEEELMARVREQVSWDSVRRSDW